MLGKARNATRGHPPRGEYLARHTDLPRMARSMRRARTSCPSRRGGDGARIVDQPKLLSPANVGVVEAGPMIYRMRIYKAIPENAASFNTFFLEHLLPVQRRHGARLI